MRASIALLALALCVPLAAQVPAHHYVARDRALAILAREDSFRAIEFVMAMNDPRDTMGVFALLTRDLYWENRNLPAAMAIGRAGIQFGIDNDMRSEAKALAYDLSSFCWPGWNEPGVMIEESDLIMGQDLAKTNMRLALTLRKGDVPMSRAHWLIGAHHLAIDQVEAARRAFVEALRFAIAAESKEQELLMRGYLYLADMMLDPDNADVEAEFEFTLRELENSREGTFYSEQLETARGVFAPTP